MGVKAETPADGSIEPENPKNTVRFCEIHP